MSEFLFQYHAVSPTTWAYLSSLLMIGLFFKFNRVFSFRNLDLILLIGLAPGLLFIHSGNSMQLHLADADAAPSEDITKRALDTDNMAGDSGETNSTTEAIIRGRSLERWGYFWLLSVGGIWLVRLLADTAMVRRPLLAPNLTVGGLTFIGFFLFLFLMANVAAMRPLGTPANGDAPSAKYPDARMDVILAYQQGMGPGYSALNALPPRTRKNVVIFAHFAIVTGMVLFGYRHFGNINSGIAAATLYLMLPYTSQMTGRIDHVLPAALLVWSVVFYRMPLVSGLFLGCACGCIYYPFFLLPLWLSFYWKRGLWRFVLSVVVVLSVMTAILSVVSESTSLVGDLQRMFGLLRPKRTGLEGIWDQETGGWPPVYRLPVLAAFVAMSGTLAIWPARKDLGTLLSCGAAMMLASQLWHGFGGGLYIAWYLPLLLLTIFRPNLEDRVAESVLDETWIPRRLGRTAAATEL